MSYCFSVERNGRLAAVALAVGLASSMGCGGNAARVKPGIHETLQNGVYRFSLVTAEGAEMDFTMQPVNDGQNQPLTDGRKIGSLDLGHDRVSFLLANENSGEIGYWADIDKSSLTVTFHDLAGGADQMISVVEKAGEWILRPADGSRIDITWGASSAISSGRYVPASEMGKVKGILNAGNTYDFYRQTVNCTRS